jgi:Fe-S cluster assembly protein SufD
MSATSLTLPLLEALEATQLGVDPADKAKALHTLENTPLPTTRDEAWKYTRVAKLGKLSLKNQRETLTSVAQFLPDPQAPHLIFVNGHFQASLSKMPQDERITIESLENGVALDAQHQTLEGEFFNALNTAHLHGGCRVTVPSNVELEEKIQIIQILKGAQIVANTKTLITLGRNAKASFTYGFFSKDAESALCNARCEINLGENAHLTIDKLQYEAGNCFHIGGEWIEQERDSTLTLNTITLRGGLVRNDVHVRVNGQNCTSNLHGVYLLKEQQHVDNHTVIDHRVPNCASNELYKGVIDDKGTAVFNGKVFVRPDAQKINAFQSNGNVLLSETGSVNSKPELEIYADDVKCSHGSTTGQLDEEAVFYLRARGVSEKAARQLMVAAFVEDVLEKIEDEAFLSYVHSLLKSRFGWEFNP